MLGILAISLLKRSPLWIIPWEVLECPFAAKFLDLTLQSNIILYILCVGMLIGILANLNAYLIPLLLSININKQPNKYNTLYFDIIHKGNSNHRPTAAASSSVPHNKGNFYHVEIAKDQIQQISPVHHILPLKTYISV